MRLPDISFISNQGREQARISKAWLGRALFTKILSNAQSHLMLFTISAIRFVPGHYLPLVDKTKPHRNPDVLTTDKTVSRVMAQITQPTTFAAYVKEKGLLGSKLLADIAV